MADVNRGSYDLNADVGEGFDTDDELLDVITSANVACGFHAGDRDTMRYLCACAAERGVAVGAQVSYRDREGFGRRALDVAYDVLVADVTEQVLDLTEAAAAAGIRLSYLKPHGALYNRVVNDDGQAAAVVAVASRFGLPVLTLASSRLAERAGAAGLSTYREFFADRTYDDEGRLVSRDQPGAVIDSATVVRGRVRSLVADGRVQTVTGRSLGVQADSICVHGDTAGAVELARAVRAELEGLGVDVVRFA